MNEVGNVSSVPANLLPTCNCLWAILRYTPNVDANSLVVSYAADS
jgi:hypothetical protein